MVMCRPREIEAFGKPPRQPLEREQLRTLKHLSATLRYAFLLMDAQASDCLGSNPSRLRANSQVTALGAKQSPLIADNNSRVGWKPGFAASHRERQRGADSSRYPHLRRIGV